MGVSWEGLWGDWEGVWVERNGEGSGALGTDAFTGEHPRGLSGCRERQGAPDPRSAPSRARTRPGSSGKSAASSPLPPRPEVPAWGLWKPARRDGRGVRFCAALPSLQTGVASTKPPLPALLGAPAAGSAATLTHPGQSPCQGTEHGRARHPSRGGHEASAGAAGRLVLQPPGPRPSAAAPQFPARVPGRSGRSTAAAPGAGAVGFSPREGRPRRLGSPLDAFRSAGDGLVEGGLS